MTLASAVVERGGDGPRVAGIDEAACFPPDAHRGKALPRARILAQVATLVDLLSTFVLFAQYVRNGGASHARNGMTRRFAGNGASVDARAGWRRAEDGHTKAVVAYRIRRVSLSGVLTRCGQQDAAPRAVDQAIRSRRCPDHAAAVASRDDD